MVYISIYSWYKFLGSSQEEMDKDWASTKRSLSKNLLIWQPMTYGLPPNVLQPFPTVVLVISHQKGTRFCYDRRIWDREDPLVQQGRTIEFLLPRIFPQLLKRQSPSVSYGPNVNKEAPLGPFLKPSACLLINNVRPSLKSCKLYLVMSVKKT